MGGESLPVKNKSCGVKCSWETDLKGVQILLPASLFDTK